MWVASMKVAIVSTAANFDVAQRMIDGLLHSSTITHYFKRGAVCQKRNSQSTHASHVTLSRFAMIKDIQAERFDQFFVVELPHGRTNVLPFYALVAILSKAPEKFIMCEDGHYTAVTIQSVVKLIIAYSVMFLRYISVVPLLIANVALLIAGSVVVDVILSVMARPKEDSSNNAGRGVLK